MSVLNDILLDVIGLAQATGPYATIVVGALPADNGITMTYGAGGVDTTFMTKGILYDLDIALNGKHSNAKIVSDALNNIHQALTQATSYPRTDTYQITDISTISTPSYLDREQNSQILYGSSLRVKAFIFNK